MCKRNSLHKNEGSMGCVRETPHRALVVLSFQLWGFMKEGSFQFWGLVLRPFSTCSSLMSFGSPFSRFLWLLSLLVASFFCSLLSPFFCVLLFRVLFLGRIPPSSFHHWFCSQQSAELGSIHFLAFSARACSLAFLCLAILFLAICRAVFYIFISFSKARA